MIRPAVCSTHGLCDSETLSVFPPHYGIVSEIGKRHNIHNSHALGTIDVSAVSEKKFSQRDKILLITGRRRNPPVEHQQARPKTDLRVPIALIKV